MKTKRLFIRIIGIFFLLVGLGALFAFPAEFTSFYAFSNGGAFTYEGFGFGSLLFAVILTSALIYAALALICIPIGIGNATAKYWGYRLTRIFFLVVMTIGASSIVCLGASFHLVESVGILPYIIILLMLILTLILLPYLLLRFYKNRETKEVFSPSQNTRFENQSDRKMVVVLLNLVWGIVFAMLIFFKGAFPFMGRFLIKTQGTYLLSAVILALMIFTYLYYKYSKWTRLIMLVFYAFLGSSVVVSFLILPVGDFIAVLEPPAYEVREMASLLDMISEIRIGWFFGGMLVIQTFLLLTAGKKAVDKH